MSNTCSWPQIYNIYFISPSFPATLPTLFSFRPSKRPFRHAQAAFRQKRTSRVPSSRIFFVSLHPKGDNLFHNLMFFTMKMKRILLSFLALVAIGTGARAQDMTATPLTLEATTEGDITFSVTYQYDHPVVLTPIEYKINDGSWTTYSWPTDEAAITSGEDWPHTFGNAIHVEV